MAGFGGILKWLFPILAFFVIWQYVLPMVGLSPTTSMILSAVFTLGVVLLLGKFFPVLRLPIPFLSKLNMIVLAVMVAGPLIAGGILSIPSGETAPGSTYVPNVGTGIGGCGNINPELIGKSATLNINAWDMESTTPYSAAVDLTTGCWLYKNGKEAVNYAAPSADTQDGVLSSKFAVGDMAYIYCGGTTYYTDPYEACINSETFPVNLEIHTMVATSELQITGYDNGGSSALSAGSSNLADYNLTLGANQEDTIYLKLKVNVAANSFQFDGWAIAKLNNITAVEPVNGDGRSYSQGITPVAFQGIAVATDTSGVNPMTKDYAVWVADNPIMIHQWESIKDQFYVKAGSSNPEANTENSTSMDGFAICAFDGTYSRGADGAVTFGYYTDDVSQSNVGMTETLTNPIGKDNCVLISAN